jgi:hypothetical protein
MWAVGGGCAGSHLEGRYWAPQRVQAARATPGGVGLSGPPSQIQHHGTIGQQRGLDVVYSTPPRANFTAWEHGRSTIDGARVLATPISEITPPASLQ